MCIRDSLEGAHALFAFLLGRNEQVYLQFGSPTELIVANRGLKQGCPSASPFYAILASFQVQLLHRLAPWLAPSATA
eukprot:448973-Prorocentrum_lima.AAC.1